MNYSRLWELLGKKTAGEATEKELAELQDLLKEQNEDAQYMLNVMDSYWKATTQASESQKINDITLLRKKETLDKLGFSKEEQPVILNSPFVKNKRRWILAAAAVACLIGGWFVYQTVSEPEKDMNVVVTKNGSKTKVALPDGTEVWLNAGSKLSYPSDFKHVPNREITLEGEAYFDVKHNASQPFIIHTDDLDIKDLGTAFNVKAYPKDNVTEATLISGSIEVILRDNPGRKLILKPHEKVSYYEGHAGFELQNGRSDPDKKEIKELHPLKHIPDRLEVTGIQPMVLDDNKDTVVVETAWMNNQMIFRSEDFSHLAERMERWYNVKIYIRDEAVKKYTFTGIFEGETLEQALKELQMIRPFQYQLKKNEVLISN